FLLKASYNQSMNEIVKLIVQPRCVKCIQNPHAFTFIPNYFAVNSVKKPLKEGQMGQNIVLDTACINHYWFGSLQWLHNCKIPRREKWGIKLRQESLEQIIAAHNIVKDESIQKFVPELKQNMEKTKTKNAIETSPSPISTFPTYNGSFITCDLMGQLGNQFFQIATATSLAWDCGATAVFPSLITEKQFNIPLNYSKIFYHLNTNQPNLPIDHTHIESKFFYTPIPIRPNMLIRGWFQSEKYFRHHKHEIMSLFAPHSEIIDYLHEKYEHILLQENTVSIHLRSYDIEDPQHLVYEKCGIDYFMRAINIFPEDSLYVVFSNDIEWCKNNFTNIAREFIFIEGEAHYHDLYLMSMCKHNIICNSSFSWWGAYLNNNPDKIVVAPAKWFNPLYEAKDNSTKDLIPEEWMRI
ncbi:MAG: alpha-1,2-fucosyltransferase, partial [Parachlamydiaceae bacterium]|nr:alpha-1,2-fucosyltransferase [Parachlamydiaceae bacterium]